METTVPRFLRYLKVERDASELTIKSYREDLIALQEYLADSFQREARVGEVTTSGSKGVRGGSKRGGLCEIYRLTTSRLDAQLLSLCTT